MSLRLVLIAILAVGGAARARADGDAAEIAETRKAVERSLPFIEQEGVAWMSDRGCVTCHQTPFLIWAHTEAKRRGFAVDERKLSEWTNWALLKVISGEDGSTSQGADTLSQMLLGRAPRAPLTAKPAKRNRTIDPYENALKNLLKDQLPDGSWLAGGQSGNPPDIPTGWALYALAAREELLKADGAVNPSKDLGPGLVRIFTANREALPRSRDRGLGWFRTVKEDAANDLNEQLVVRPLVERTYGQPDRVKERVRELTARQNADGGWTANPKRNRGSDAFATGQAPFALVRSGVAVDDPAVRKGRDYLLKVQGQDGSWEVRTPTFHAASGRPDRDRNTDEVYTYWGTAWGTLGLLHTLPMPARGTQAGDR